MMLHMARNQLGVCSLVTVLAGSLACGHAAAAGDQPGNAFESIPPGEAAQIEETVSIGLTLQDKRKQNDPSQEGRLLRGVHAKSHGCVKAKFVVNDDIDETYRVGLFADPGKAHEAWIRFSNAAVLREDDLKGDGPDDRKNGSRGMAIKVMDVEGEMLDKDNGQSNQDFLMVNTPEFAFANVRDYLRLNRILKQSDKGHDPKPYFLPAAIPQLQQKLAALEQQLQELGAPAEGEPAEVAAARNKLQAGIEGLRATIPALQAAVENNPLVNNLSEAEMKGTIASATVVNKITAQTVRNPMQVQYFGAAPFLFGEGRVMKFSAAPCTAIQQAEFEEITPDNPTKNYLRDALGETMSGTQVVCYDFKIQVRGADSDIGELKIEDATTTWPDEEANYVDVAKISIEVPQSPHTPEALEQCEKLAFAPWHSLAVHRPIGGINRLRRKVYSESAKHRGAAGY